MNMKLFEKYYFSRTKFSANPTHTHNPSMLHGSIFVKLVIQNNMTLILYIVRKKCTGISTSKQ